MNVVARILVLMSIIVSTSACSYVFGRTITLKVEDQNQKPVPEAEVIMVFQRSHGGDRRDKVTDENGIAKARGRDLFGVKTIVTKPGYYLSERGIGGEDSIETSIKLREKKNPLPMYVKEITMQIPETETKFGFDLETGKVLRADRNKSTIDMYFWLSGHNRSQNDVDANMRMSFKNEESGIKKVDPVSRYSEFQFPYSAPAEGYVSQIQRSYQYGSGDSADDPLYKSNIDEGALGYVFRIVKNGDESEGEKSVTYGRIMGEFEFHIAPGDEPGGEIYLTYYYNSDPGSRSLEFNPQRNLFRDAEQTYPP